MMDTGEVAGGWWLVVGERRRQKKRISKDEMRDCGWPV